MSKPVCYMGIYNEHDIRDMHTVVVRYVTDFKSNPDRVIPLYEHPPVPTTERPYNPLNDYAVIPMPPTTEPVKAQAGEPVAWMKTNGGNGNEKVFISAHMKQRGYDDFDVPLFTHPTTERRVIKDELRDDAVGVFGKESDAADKELFDLLLKTTTERRVMDEQFFTEWLCREMPAGTVIGNPKWWVPKILNALNAAPAKGEA